MLTFGARSDRYILKKKSHKTIKQNHTTKKEKKRIETYLLIRPLNEPKLSGISQRNINKRVSYFFLKFIGGFVSFSDITVIHSLTQTHDTDCTNYTQQTTNNKQQTTKPSIISHKYIKPQNQTIKFKPLTRSGISSNTL